MCVKDKISRLLSADLGENEIVGVSYESSDCFSFSPDVQSRAFYRIVCHSSYEPGSFVRHEIWLPEDWNGIYLGLGNGGQQARSLAQRFPHDYDGMIAEDL